MRKLRIKRSRYETTQINMRITKAALGRLREASDENGVGHAHILSMLLETFDFEILREPAKAFLAKYQKPKADPAEVEAYLTSLPEAERLAFLERFKQ